MADHPRVLIAAEHASARFGGEAVLPLHYFRLLRERGVDAHLLVHDRTRDELDALLAADRDRITYVPDTRAHRAIFGVGSRMPRRLGDVTAGVALRLLTQQEARRKARKLIERHRIDVVHQPMPVSPKDPSLLFGLGVPVVIGPMNGGMLYPRAFRALESRAQRTAVEAARAASHLVHRVIPGKIEATTLLVANDRTRRALPIGVRGRVEELVENAVDLRLFDAGRIELERRSPSDPLRVVFVGRLVDWKGLDILLEAIGAARARAPITLDVYGDGPMRDAWKHASDRAGLDRAVTFHGFVPQTEIPRRLAQSNVLALPSLYECGGAVVLEAMALGVPVIACAWGGPLDYLDETTGVLVPPDDRATLVRGFVEALHRFAIDPTHAEGLGRRGRDVVAEKFDWRKKIDRILAIYEDAITRFAEKEAA
jgi:glycosyltransferase involved in cell wall biosynthesis